MGAQRQSRRKAEVHTGRTDQPQQDFSLHTAPHSTQHDPEVTQEQIYTDIKKYVFEPVLPKELVDENTKYYILVFRRCHTLQLLGTSRLVLNMKALPLCAPL